MTVGMEGHGQMGSFWTTGGGGVAAQQLAGSVVSEAWTGPRVSGIITVLEVPKTSSVSQSTRQGWWSHREAGRSLMGLLRDQEAIQGTHEDRQESMVWWKLTAEHFRRRVCPRAKAAEVQEMLPGIIYPPKLVVRASLVTSAKTAAVLCWGLMPIRRELKCNER